MFTIIGGSLICGIIVDKYKRYSAFCISFITIIAFLASLVQLIAFLILACIPDNAPKWIIYFAFVLYGLSFAIFLTSYWPCIKFTVPSGLSATAFGLSFCFQAILMFLGPILTGYIIDKTKEYSGGYFAATIVFVVIGLFSTIVSGIVLITDYKKDRILFDQIPQLEGMELDA